MATKRLQKEVTKAAKLAEENPNVVACGPEGDDLFHWKGTISGPSGTVYEGGMFTVDLLYPSDFPFKPPTVKFGTKIYHCNINDDGTICLDILKDKWSPKLGVADIMNALTALLHECNPDDALVPEIADKYKSNKAEHDAKAREFTQKYAKN